MTNENYFFDKHFKKVYDAETESRVLWYSKDKNNGIISIIISLNTHPCCYLGIPKSSFCYMQFKHINDYDCDIIMRIKAHGGITYLEEGLFIFSREWAHGGYRDKQILDVSIKEKHLWLGWDYAHAGDYFYTESGIYRRKENKKWTFRELMNDCLEVKYQIEHGYHYTNWISFYSNF